MGYLLGREVRDGSDDHPMGDALLARLHRPCQTEVGDLDASVVGDEHVLWLDVAMDEPRSVGGGECLQHRVEEHQCLLGGEWPEVAQDVTEGAARDVFHREVHVLAVGALVVDRDHMAVGEPRRRLGLALEAGDEGLIVGQVGVHDLQCDDAVEAEVCGDVDGGHPAAGDHALDAVPAVEDTPDQRVLGARGVRVLHPCESK